MTPKNTEYKNIIYMKYGVHASENPKDIILRKQKEIENNGWTLWGYGGKLCYPTSQVQPFVKNCEKNEPVHLVMEFTSSPHISTSDRAKYYSVEKTDDTSWLEIPETIDVYGSTLALCIKDLTECNFNLDLNAYEVAIGPSKGKNLGEYIRCRTDKGCATLAEMSSSDNHRPVLISLTAEILDPYAVFVK